MWAQPLPLSTFYYICTTGEDLFRHLSGVIAIVTEDNKSQEISRPLFQIVWSVYEERASVAPPPVKHAPGRQSCTNRFIPVEA